ncbi:MAG: hypothetical protein PF440_07125 [Thiomicrorhabdus sp.]|jgi:hypothetical protein|nr:hypothetical protein [Thiomicrorhabdus sp.]
MERFTESILPEVPGCSKYAIKQAVLRTAIQFCQDSLIWQLAAEKTILADASTLTLSTGTGAQIAKCYLFENEIRYKDFTRSEDTVTLYEAVTADTDFDTISFLKPTETATALPDILYHDWYSGIEAGAKKRLQVQANKSWYNEKLAAYNNVVYTAEYLKARVAARRTGEYTQFLIKRETDY